MSTKIFTFALLPVIGLLFYFLIDGVKGPIDEKVEIAAIEKDIVDKLKFLREVQIAYELVNRRYCGSWDELKRFIDEGERLIIQKKEITKLDPDTQVEDIEVIVDTLGSVAIKQYIREKYVREKLDDSKLDEYFADPAIIPWSAGKDKRFTFTLYAGKVYSGDLELSVFEVRDEYPRNPARGGELQANGEPYSVTRLLAHFDERLKEKTEEAKVLLKEKKGADEARQAELDIQLDEISKYINLYDKRTEQLNTKPLKVGSRDEATTSGNWE